MSSKSYDTIVIGGGQAGLASGYHLQNQGLSYLILESQPEAVGSWPRYYDSLKLFSPARYSSLPGMEFPGEMGNYPRRDDVISYFKQYAKRFSLSVKANEHIVQVRQEDGRFNIYTASGNTYVSKTIINATGSFHSPYTPRINGTDKFKGKVIHSSVYRNAEPYKNQRVIVVGRGNSAVQIAIELADVSQTSLAVLKPVHFTKQRILGKDIHFWFRLTGLDTFPFWRFGIKSPNPASVIDLDNYKNRIDACNPDQKTMFNAFYSEGVIWPNGEKEKVDSVIFATGYKSSLFHLEGLGAVDENGDPLQKGGVSTAVPGLYYVGLYGQRSFASATIRGVGSDAEYVVKQLMRYLKRT